METDVIDLLIDWVRNRFFGKYRGVVVDDADPTHRGRLKVRVPAVLGDLAAWAMPCVPYAGDGVGFLSLPPKEAGVWVEFEAGDPSFPIWTGCFWGAGEAPDDASATVKTWKTPGFALRMDGTVPELRMEADSGPVVRIDDKVTTDAGGSTHTVGSDGIISEAGAGKVDVSASGVNLNDGALEVT